MARDHKRGVSTKGYYDRAKTFGIMMLIVAIIYLFYQLYTLFSG